MHITTRQNNLLQVIKVKGHSKRTKSQINLSSAVTDGYKYLKLDVSPKPSTDSIFCLKRQIKN